jgi:hypothetical protein
MRKPLGQSVNNERFFNALRLLGSNMNLRDANIGFGSVDVIEFFKTSNNGVYFPPSLQGYDRTETFTISLRYKPLSTNTDPNLVTLELTRTFNIR